MKIDPTISSIAMNKSPEQEAITRDIKLKDATKKLEGVFASFMLQELSNSLAKQNGSMPGGSIYSDFYSQILSKKITEGKGLGLAEILYQSMSDMKRAGAGVLPIEPEVKVPFSPTLESSSRTNKEEPSMKLGDNLS
ncbi:MAG: hypothetical protein AAGA18_01130 [Verrucomicrobiota bacterium]